jgi:hypothetical protein
MQLMLNDLLWLGVNDLLWLLQLGVKKSVPQPQKNAPLQDFGCQKKKPGRSPGFFVF